MDSLRKKVRSIDKTQNVRFNLKYCKTKQVVPVNRDGILSKFATGKFSNKKTRGK